MSYKDALKLLIWLKLSRIILDRLVSMVELEIKEEIFYKVCVGAY